jgi:hypothetical protein
MFPQVITRVVDKSQITQLFSRFRCGLVGIAQKGPFDQVVDVPSIFEFVRQFGQPLDGSYLGDAVQLIAQTSDGCKVARVGVRYETESTNNASGAEGSFAINTPSANLYLPGQYLRISQIGKDTTLNARINTIVGNTINLVNVGGEAVPLADTYNGATIGKAGVPNAANSAEGWLTAPAYGAAIAGLGTVVGDKNAYFMTVTGTFSSINPGDVLKIAQSGRTTTNEIRVKSVRGDGTVFFEVTNLTDIGYQALPLQDSYTAALVYRVTNQTSAFALQLQAATEGTWANTQGSATGITVQVAPGSAPGSKKLLIYDGSVNVETIDNLVMDPNDPNYYITRINGNSSYITVVFVFGTEPPGNTYNPWNLSIASPSNIAQFSGGFNGENVTDLDYIGTIDPSDDQPSGLKLFQDPNDLLADVDFITVPDATSTAVFQEMARIASLINAIGIGHVPDGLNAREAIDWHNGTGLYSANGRIDNYRFAIFWNWFEIADTFTGALKFIPPSIGYLRCAARTFDQFKPWFAAAGDIRGNIPEATDIRYRRVSTDVKNAMYGNGNSVNPILVYSNSIEVYGDRTMQRLESKLTALHSVVLVNYILKGFSTIARRYTFDPIDDVLYQQVRLDCSNFMEAVKSERGVEAYSLTIDASNNTPDTRNNRQVIIDLSIIPTDVAEVFIITATVEKSGATLNNVSSTPN